MRTIMLALLCVGCTSPVDPAIQAIRDADHCVRQLVAAPGHTLNADSLRAELWVVLPGDTIAFQAMPGGCSTP